MLLYGQLTPYLNYLLYFKLQCPTKCGLMAPLIVNMKIIISFLTSFNCYCVYIGDTAGLCILKCVVNGFKTGFLNVTRNDVNGFLKAAGDNISSKRALSSFQEPVHIATNSFGELFSDRFNGFLNTLFQ